MKIKSTAQQSQDLTEKYFDVEEVVECSLKLF